MSDFPGPFDPPELTVPNTPPEVGFGSPWVPADGENRDRILDWWRAWWRRVFFPWLANFIAYLNTWLEDAEAYIIAHAIAGYSMRVTADALNPTGTTNVTITVGEDTEFRPLVVGDIVLDQTIDSRFGVVTAVIDATHATVETLGSVKGSDGHGWWLTVTVIAHAGTTAVVLPTTDRLPQLGDFVVDTSASAAYGEITAITDAAHVTVTFVNVLQGPQGVAGPAGAKGDTGDPGPTGVVASIVAGTNVTVDATDPANPVVSASGGGGGGTVDSVVAGNNISVDATDPANPIVNAVSSVASNPNTIVRRDGAGDITDTIKTVVAGTNVVVDATDPHNPIVSVPTAGVETIVAGTHIQVTGDPHNPTVGLTGADTAANPDTVAIRDGNAELQVRAYSPSGGTTATAAVYVDAYLISQHDTAHAPVNPFLGGQTEGQLYYDTTLHKLRVWTGSAWETITSV